MQFIIYLLGILGFSYTVFASQYESIVLNTAFGYYDPWLPNIVCMTVAVFVFFQYAINPYLERYASLLEIVSQHMLGVYLIHPFVMIILEKLNITILLFPVQLSIPFFSIIIFFISYISSYLLKKIPILGNLLC